MNTALSLVMPVFNERHLIEEAVLQTLGILGAGDELVVVDGGSSDGTWQLLLDMEARCNQSSVDGSQQGDQVKAKFVCLQSRKGRANQMNTGSRLASTDTLLFLHADTKIEPAAVQCLRDQILTLSPGLRFWGRFNVRIEGLSPWLPVIAWFMNQRSRLTRIATGDQGIFVSRSLFQRVGGYYDQPLMEDIELCKTLNTQPDAFFLPLEAKLSTSGRRWDQRGAWPTIWLMWRFRFQYWRGVSAYDLARRYRDVRLTEEAEEAAQTKLAGLGGSGASGVESPFEKSQR